MGQHDTYARALARAAEMVGSVEALALRLHFPAAVLRAWINGTQEVPVPVFLTVVDLLMGKELAQIPRDPAQQGAQRPGDEQSAKHT